jgi:hypothetical protein
VNEFWSALIQNVLMGFVPVLASLLVAYLFAQFKLAWAKFQAARPDITSQMEWAARIAVNAAEQAGSAGIIAGKKEYALDFAEKWLKAQGFTVDLHLLDGAIEAAVYEELNKDKSDPKPAAGYSLPSMGQ